MIQARKITASCRPTSFLFFGNIADCVDFFFRLRHVHFRTKKLMYLVGLVDFWNIEIGIMHKMRLKPLNTVHIFFIFIKLFDLKPKKQVFMWLCKIFNTKTIFLSLIGLIINKSIWNQFFCIQCFKTDLLTPLLNVKKIWRHFFRYYEWLFFCEN